MSNGEVAKIKKSDLYPIATEIAAGLMSSSDKIKLNNPEFSVIAAGTLDANKCTRRGVYIPNSSSANVPMQGNSGTLIFLPGSDPRYGCQLFFNSDGFWIRSFMASMFKEWGSIGRCPQ